MEIVSIFDEIFWDEERDGPQPKKKGHPRTDIDYFFATCTSEELVDYMIETSNED